jgi:hypothetical protein
MTSISIIESESLQEEICPEESISQVTHAVIELDEDDIYRNQPESPVRPPLSVLSQPFTSVTRHSGRYYIVKNDNDKGEANQLLKVSMLPKCY